MQSYCLYNKCWLSFIISFKAADNDSNEVCEVVTFLQQAVCDLLFTTFTDHHQLPEGEHACIFFHSFIRYPCTCFVEANVYTFYSDQLSIHVSIINYSLTKILPDGFEKLFYVAFFFTNATKQEANILYTGIIIEWVR